MKRCLFVLLVLLSILLGSCKCNEPEVVPPDPCDSDCMNRPETGEILDDVAARIYIGTHVGVVLDSMGENSATHFLACNMPDDFKINDYHVRITAKVTYSCSENLNGFDYIKVTRVYKY